jgi:hypothetical protein
MDQWRHSLGGGHRPGLHLADLSTDVQVGPAIGAPDDVPGGGVDVAHLPLDHDQDVDVPQDSELMTALRTAWTVRSAPTARPMQKARYPVNDSCSSARASYWRIRVRGVVTSTSTSP